MAWLVLAAFIALPVAEIAVFIQLGQWIGLWWTLAGIFLTALAGVVIVRLQGLSLLAELRARVEAGDLPARQVAEGLMVALAGALLVVPGYLTDAVGLALLIPPLRGAIYGALAARVRVVDPTPEGRDVPRPPEVIELREDDWRDR